MASGCVSVVVRVVVLLVAFTDVAVLEMVPSSHVSWSLHWHDKDGGAGEVVDARPAETPLQPSSPPA